MSETPGLIDLGGRMPDGSVAQSCLVARDDFVCASGSMLSSGPIGGVLGKLCLTRSSLVLLPYTGEATKLASQAATKLRSLILGPYAELADGLEKLGLYAAAPRLLEHVLVWPLATISSARVELRDFLVLHSGAELFIGSATGEFGFSLRRSGAEVDGFASAETFQREILARLASR